MSGRFLLFVKIGSSFRTRMEVEGDVIYDGTNQEGTLADFLEEATNPKSGEASASLGNVATDSGKGVTITVTPPPPPPGPHLLPAFHAGQGGGSVNSGLASMPQGTANAPGGMPNQRQVVDYSDMTLGGGGIFGTAALAETLQLGTAATPGPSQAEVRAARKLRQDQAKADMWNVRMEMLGAAAGSKEAFKTDLLARMPKSDQESGKIEDATAYLNLAYSRDFDKTLEEYEVSKWKNYSAESKNSQRVKDEVKDLFIKAVRGEFTLKAKREKEAKKVAKAKEEAAKRKKRKESKDDKKSKDDPKSKDKGRKKDDDGVFLPGTSTYAPKPKSTKTSGEKRKHSSDGSNQPPPKRPSTGGEGEKASETALQASDIVKNVHKAKFSMQLKEVVVSTNGNETLREVGRDVWEGTLIKKLKEALEIEQDKAQEAEEEMPYPIYHDMDFINGKVYIVPIDEYTMKWTLDFVKKLKVGHSSYKVVMTSEVAKAALFNVVIKTCSLSEDLNKAWKRTVFLSGLPKGETSYVKKEAIDTTLTRVIFAASKNAIKAICKADQAKRRRAGDINYGGKDLEVRYFRDPVTSLDIDKMVKFNYDV